MLLDLASDVYQVLELSWLPWPVSRLSSFDFFLREYILMPPILLLFAVVALTAIMRISGISEFFRVRAIRVRFVVFESRFTRSINWIEVLSDFYHVIYLVLMFH